MIKTTCDKCVFAKFEQGEQTGCNFDRLDKFIKQGVAHKTDNYYEIHRFCSAARPIEWGKEVDQKEWVATARLEMTLRCELLIYAGINHTLYDIQKTLESVNQQVLKPTSVVIALNNPSIHVASIIASIKKYHFKWRVETPVNRGEEVSKEAVLEKSLLKCTTNYFTLFNAGYIIDNTFLLNLDRELNDNLARFSLIVPDDEGNGLVCQTKLYRLVDGWKPLKSDDSDEVLTDLVEKIRLLALDREQSYMVWEAQSCMSQ